MSINDLLSHKARWIVEVGDAAETLRNVPNGVIHTSITSPPYYNLRDYEQEGQIGNEESLDEYIERLVHVYREVRRVLRDDGTAWINIGDTYMKPDYNAPRVKRKDMIGVPWKVAFALQADGWYLRSAVPWVKCLSGGTYVYVRSSRGDMPMLISELVRRDWTKLQLWNGERWTRIIGIQRSSSDRSDQGDSPGEASKYLEVQLRSGERIGCTRDHLWPLSDGQLKEAGDLKVGDVLASTNLPEPDAPASPSFLPDDDIGWLVGLYLAEGSRSGSTIQIASHKKELARYSRLRSIAASLHGTCRKHDTSDNGMTINLTGSAILGVIDAYIGGEVAKNKRLTTACWQRSNAFLRSLLMSYLEADANFDESANRYRLGFCLNPFLARDLRVLAARLGMQIRLRKAKHKAMGREYPGYKGEIRLIKENYDFAGSRFACKRDSEIVKIRSSRGRSFWDISVEDKPNLFALASGVLTHNCNAMPEFVNDRPNQSVEYCFMLSKKARYYFDMEAAKECLGVRRNWRNGDAMQLLDVPTSSKKNSHVAIMPEELAKPMIVSCISQKGCCPVCGAPWLRQIKRETIKGKSGMGEKSKKLYGKKCGGKSAPTVGIAVPHDQRVPTITTLGWAKSCEHDHSEGDVVPSIVLDPFAGSGTTGVVALGVKGSFLGVELNPEYAKIARTNLQTRSVDLFEE